MIINLWRIWDIWFEAMARSQDFSAPWRTAPARRTVGRYESLSATK